MSVSFLFHVPGARDAINPSTHTFRYNDNWLTLTELKQLDNQPREVEVWEVIGRNRSIKLGRIRTSVALLKYT
jgi:hypothetical protein